MGTYVYNGKVNLGSSYDYSVAVQEIASLIGVGARPDGKIYLADLAVGAGINPLARCKPFPYKAWNFASASARNTARNTKSTSLNDDAPNNGFGPTPEVYVANGEITHGVYQYSKRPKGGENSPARIRDFDGYWHNAVSPMKLNFSSSFFYKEAAGIAINFHDTSTGWNASDCLYVHEMTDSYRTQEYVSILMVGGGYSWLLPSNVKLSDITDGSLKPVVIAFGTDNSALSGNAQNSSINGAYRMDSNYSSLAEGTEIHIAVVTSPNYWTKGTVMSPFTPQGNYGSLEFVRGADRVTTTIVSEQSLTGLTWSLSENSWGNVKSIAKPNEQVYAAYEWQNADLTLRINTPDTWKRTSVLAEVTIVNLSGNTYDAQNNLLSTVTFNRPIYTRQAISGGSYVPVPSGTFSINLLDEGNLSDYKFAVNYSGVTSLQLVVSVAIYRDEAHTAGDVRHVLSSKLIYLPL